MPTVRHLFTTEQAYDFVKAAPRGTSFCLSIRNPMPKVDHTGAAILGEEIRDGFTTWVEISRKQALHVLSYAQSEACERAGGRIPVRVSRADKGRSTIWVGA